MRNSTAKRRRGMQRGAGVRVCDVFRDVHVDPEAHEVHGQVVSSEQRDPPPGAPPASHENFRSRQSFNPGLDPLRDPGLGRIELRPSRVLMSPASVRFSPRSHHGSSLPPCRGPHGLSRFIKTIKESRYGRAPALSRLSVQGDVRRRLAAITVRGRSSSSSWSSREATSGL